MNNDRIEGNWEQFKGKVKETWGKLTDDDVTLLKGKSQQFFGRLQEKHGVAQDEAEKHLKQFESSCGYCYTDKNAA